MKIRYILVPLLGAWAFSWGATYTLDQLLVDAFHNSRTLQSVENEMHRSESQVNQAVAGALPMISATANLSHAFAQYDAFNPQRTTFDTAGLSPDAKDALSAISPLLPKRFDDSLNFYLNVNQPIYSQGKTVIGVKIAKLYQRTLMCKYAQAKMNLRAAVTKAYYSALLAQRTEQIKTQAVDLAQETHTLTIVQTAVGKGSELDTLSSRIRLENTRIDLNRSRSDKRVFYDDLITLTGLNENASHFAVQGDFPAPESLLTIDEVIRRVHSNNTTITQLKGKEAIEDQLVKFARTDFFPRIYASASIGKIGLLGNLTDVTKGSSYFDNQSVGLGLSWTLFDGMETFQKLTQAKIDRENFILSEGQIIDSLDLLTRSVYEKVANSLDEVKAMQVPLTLAQKAYQIAKTAYEVGSGTLLDVQNAELNLNTTRISCLASIFTFNTAMVDLNVLMDTP